MAGGCTIALALEGQLRLDDQRALHEAVALARRHRGGRLIVLAWWPEQPHGAAFHAPGGIQNRRPEWVADRESFARWTRADSGHPLIDAQRRELLATGYLSNRGRQWVASHFVNDLRLPWTWGARFFERRLIDAHPAVNTGNWANLAGVGSDPRSFGGPPRRFDLDP